MSSLTSFKSSDGIEIFVDFTTNETFASISGYARMSGKSQSTISERVQKVHRKDLLKDAEILTPKGIKIHRLLTEDLITDWLPIDNPEITKKFLKLGIRSFLHKLAGYTPNEVKEADQIALVLPSQEAALLAEIVARIAGVSPALAGQMAINAAIAVSPVLEPARDPLKVAIACTDTLPDTLLTVTQVGGLLKSSPVNVNKLLIEKGFQYKTDDKKSPYRPTEEGKRYGRVVPVVANGKNQTVFQLRWMPEIANKIM